MIQLSQRQIEALESISEGRYLPTFIKEDDGWHARWRSIEEDNPWIDEYVREATISPMSSEAEKQRYETLHDAWLMALRSETGLVIWDEAECAAFAAEIAKWNELAADDTSAKATITFRFKANENDTFSVSCDIPKGRRNLRALGQASFVYGPLREMKRTRLRGAKKDILRVIVSRREAEAFLRTGAHDLAVAGYAVDGCDVSADISAEMKLVCGEKNSEPNPKAKNIKHKLIIRVDGEIVDAEEIRFLLEQKSELVFFRDRWIKVDRNILKEALRNLEKDSENKLNRNEALGFALGIGTVGKLKLNASHADGWFAFLINDIKNIVAKTQTALQSTDLSSLGFCGKLRPYQNRGVEWMRTLSSHGFGALLADDMGLGKTAQAIAWILTTKERPFLVVAPLTLLSNWKREFMKFAPQLKVSIHHGADRATEIAFADETNKTDVVITSYSLLVRDYSALSTVEWRGIIVDEAQTIKNPATHSARALRSLAAPRRLALTGTPVENSVEDIWSIEEFLNPKLLGDAKTFRERYSKPILSDVGGGEMKKLRKALEPFILRRLKTDPEIAAEIVGKREMREYCVLTQFQRKEYETALAEYHASERTSGDVFALITRLKLICDGLSEYEDGRHISGGKVERLAELLESIFAAKESALIFTQYAKVGEALKNFLEKRFSRNFPFFHGSLSAREREQRIAEFNEGGEKAFILSLKAGGYGLNLVKAAHVIHFDRWWNPAVEAQATDRTHRIGQTQTVLVHLFVTEGTLEERVDDIIERKSRMAGNAIATGEGIFMKMSREELDHAIELEPEN